MCGRYFPWQVATDGAQKVVLGVANAVAEAKPTTARLTTARRMKTSALFRDTHHLLDVERFRSQLNTNPPVALQPRNEPQTAHVLERMRVELEGTRLTCLRRVQPRRQPPALLPSHEP